MGLRLYIGLGMILAIVVLGSSSAILWSRLSAKEAAIVSLTRQCALAAGDARRWQSAAQERQRVIDRQALALRRLESDGQAARTIAEAHAEKTAARIAALETRIAQLKEAAHARPEDVRELGPLVRDALQSGALGSLHR
jgi:hypothetical protein